MRTSIAAFLFILVHISGLICSVSTIVSIVLYIIDKDPKIWIPLSSVIALIVFGVAAIICLQWDKNS